MFGRGCLLIPDFRLAPLEFHLYFFLFLPFTVKEDLLISGEFERTNIVYISKILLTFGRLFLFIGLFRILM